jgi:cyclophilin family peptidyl-prolyl cis-trans isomerase
MEEIVVANSVAFQGAKRIRQFFTLPSLIALAVVLAATGGCGRHSGKKSSSGDSADSTPAGATGRSEPSKAELENPVVRIETSAGAITVRLDGVRAPGTTRNFLNYVNDKFYDNTIVHFVDPGKMILAGGYGADRAPKHAFTPIRNEAHNGVKNTRGTIAMTRDPGMIDSATSQFFINLADAPQRDHTGDGTDQYGYCVFGEVTDGLDVAEKISHAATADKGGDLAQTPDPPVVIKTVRLAH